MFSTTTVLVCLLVAAIAGGSGFFISNKFNGSQHGRTDKSGDFGTPRGGFLALFSGAVIGVWAVVALSYFVPAETVEAAYIVAAIAGCAGGAWGLFHGSTPRS